MAEQTTLTMDRLPQQSGKLQKLKLVESRQFCMEEWKDGRMEAFMMEDWNSPFRLPYGSEHAVNF